ncbi:MAG: helix-hairpin-helix domain-containing protein [Lachnospira sp.]|nr:helix-hairpin-helix domain-containing protein [Lachnospira sp.]
MNDKTILKLKSNWDKIKIIATITFIILAGTVYSVSTMIKGGKADDRIELVVTDSVISTSDGAGSHFDSSDDSTKDDSNTDIYVHICGAVINPGVYQVPAGTRVYQALELAGGSSDDAYLSGINLADKLADGQKVYIPSEGENAEGILSTDSGDVQSVMININTASEAELMTLPGIGQSRAKDIINYRVKNGLFESIDDIMKVSGIKEAAFEKIKDLIKV